MCCRYSCSRSRTSRRTAFLLCARVPAVTCVSSPCLLLWLLLCVSTRPDPDVPALAAAARLPPPALRPPGGAGDLPQPLRRPLVPHALRLTVSPGFRLAHLRYATSKSSTVTQSCPFFRQKWQFCPELMTLLSPCNDGSIVHCNVVVVVPLFGFVFSFRLPLHPRDRGGL